jgi:hypothetical protein
MPQPDPKQRKLTDMFGRTQRYDERAADTSDTEPTPAHTTNDGALRQDAVNATNTCTESQPTLATADDTNGRPGHGTQTTMPCRLTNAGSRHTKKLKQNTIPDTLKQARMALEPDAVRSGERLHGVFHHRDGRGFGSGRSRS